MKGILKSVHPKLPMRNKHQTRNFYVGLLGFTELGDPDFTPYFMAEKEGVEIHFFEFANLKPEENYGQVYIRTDDIGSLYHSMIEKQVKIHPNGPLQIKPWGQIEFSILDPDNNLLTFGQPIE